MELNLDYVIPYLGITLMQALLALIILIVGFIIIKAIGPIIKKMFMRSNLSELLAQKLATMIKFILYALLLLAVAQTLGFDTGTVLLSLSAILGLVLGFGLQDTMNNVFSGIWLAMLRPFEKGDYVELMGYSGTVGTVGTLQTEMTTLDNVFITIPNSKVSNGLNMITTSVTIRLSRLSSNVTNHESQSAAGTNSLQLRC